MLVLLALVLMWKKMDKCSWDDFGSLLFITGSHFAWKDWTVATVMCTVIMYIIKAKHLLTSKSYKPIMYIGQCCT